MQAHIQKLTESSVYVQRVAHREWQEFMVALDGYVEQLVYNIITAAPDTIVQEQGRAQAATEIRKILREAPKLMEKIEASKLKGK